MCASLAQCGERSAVQLLAVAQQPHDDLLVIEAGVGQQHDRASQRTQHHRTTGLLGWHQETVRHLQRPVLTASHCHQDTVAQVTPHRAVREPGGLGHVRQGQPVLLVNHTAERSAPTQVGGTGSHPRTGRCRPPAFSPASTQYGQHPVRPALGTRKPWAARSTSQMSRGDHGVVTIRHNHYCHTCPINHIHHLNHVVHCDTPSTLCCGSETTSRGEALMSRTDRRSKRAEARRYATLSTLGALGAVTAVGLGSAVPAQAAPADSAQARSPLYGARTFGGAVDRTPNVDPAERSPHVGPVERAPQRSTVVYTVRSGDTVSGIAARYDTTVRAIIDANDLDSRTLIRIGQTLRIPRHVGPGSGCSSSSSSKSSASGYTVRSGDTVSGIAARYDTTVRAIIDANDLDSRALIRIGQTLRIPGSGGSSSSSQAAGGSSASTGSSSSSSSSSSATSSSASSYKDRK